MFNLAVGPHGSACPHCPSPCHEPSTPSHRSYELPCPACLDHSPVKAGRAHREKLGTDVVSWHVRTANRRDWLQRCVLAATQVLTPVRRSARTSQKPTTPIGALLEVSRIMCRAGFGAVPFAFHPFRSQSLSVLQMTNFAFVNNSYLNAE